MGRGREGWRDGEEGEGCSDPLYKLQRIINQTD